MTIQPFQTFSKSFPKKCAALFLIWLALMLPFASALSITSISETPTATGATITYTTDSPATSSVVVNGKGSFPTAIESARTSHNIAITGLSPNTPYSYHIEAATVGTNPQLNTSPTRSFTTLANNGEIFFTSSIPSVVSNTRLTVTGKTIPDAFITILVNGQTKAAGVASPAGDVSLAVDLDATVAQNSLEVQIRDATSGVTKSFPSSVQLDTLYPQFNTITIPSVSSTASIHINGTANKAMKISAQVTLANGNQKTIDGATLTAAGNFGFDVDLDDGVNQVVVTGTDATGTQITSSQQVTVDSQDLELNIDFSRYTPTATDTLYVDGTVNKPGIPVRIYVDPKDKKVGPCDTTTSITVSPGQTIQNLSCYGFQRFDQVTVDGAYFEATSDTVPDNKTGLYAFSVKVTLEPRLTVFVQDQLGVGTNNGVANAQNGVNQLNSATQYSGGVVAGTAPQYSLFAVAVDNVGRVQATSPAVITKEACGSTGDFVIQLGNIYPDLIEPDYIFQGIAQISFKATLQYAGIGDPNSVVINSVGMSSRQISDADLTKLGADPSQILTPSNCIASPSSNIQGYVYMVCNLNRFPSSDIRTNITTAYDKLNALGQITFPVTFNVQYSVLDQNKKLTAKTASQCIDLPIKFDKRVNPNQYPKGLLSSTVKVLNTTVTAIDQVLKPLNTIKLVTLGACVGSKVFSVFSYASEELECSTESLGSSDSDPKISALDIPAIEQVLRGCEDIGNQECADAFSKIDKFKAAGMGKKVADSTCAEKIWSRLNTEKTTNALCDRIFCPAVPSATEYIKQVNQNPLQQATSACSQAQGAPYIPGSVSTLTKDSGCGKDYYDTWITACPTQDPLKASKEQLQNSADRATTSTSFSQVISNLNFCSAAQDTSGAKPDAIDYKGVTYYNQNTNNPTSCYHIGLPQTNSQLKDKTALITDPKNPTTVINPITINLGKNSNIAGVNADGSGNPCVVTASDGNLIYQFKDNFNQPLIYDSGKADVIKVVTTNGATTEVSAVKFAGTTNVVGSGDRALGSDGVYYHVTGKNSDGTATWEQVTPSSDKTGQFFTQVCQTTGNNNNNKNNGDDFGVYVPLKDANGNVINNGQGQNGCNPIKQAPNELKQNNAQQYIINPTDGFINSVRCACLPAIEGYLVVWRNVFNAVKNCFQATLVNGDFKSGACRSLMTTYICDWIYRAIKCITNFGGNIEGLINSGASTATGQRETGIGVIQSISKGADDMSKGMQSRYGNTATFNSLIGERKLINSICLAAFGYDWLPELDSAVSIKGGGAAINSTAFIVTADRRWISSNPTNGRATFVYEAGYFISAGSPITYSVDLVCSNDYSCKTDDGYASTACDCAQGPNAGEKIYHVDGGVADGGSTVGDSDGKGQRFITSTDAIRYDKLRLTFKDTATPGALPQVVEQHVSRIGGQEPPTCSFNLATFNFQCDYATTNQYGDVFFYGDKIKLDRDPYRIGDYLKLQVFAKVDFTKLVGTQTQSLSPSLQLPKYAYLQVLNKDSTQVLYDEVSTFSDLMSASNSGQPLIMGSGYAIGAGQTPKGVAGTVAMSSTAYSTLTDLGNQISFDPNSLSQARANGLTRYYVLYGCSLIKTEPMTINCDKFIPNSYVIVKQSIDSAANQQALQTSQQINSLLKPAGNNNLAGGLGGFVGVYTSVPIDNGVTATLNLEPSAQTAVNIRFLTRPSASGSAVLDFNTKSSSTLLCPSGVDSTTLTLTVSLHDSMAKDKTSDPSPTNSVRSPGVFVYKGQTQNVTQQITVSCNQNGNSQTITGMLPCDSGTPTVHWSSEFTAHPSTNTVEGCYCDPAAQVNAFTDANSNSIVCINKKAKAASGYICVNGGLDCYCGEASELAASPKPTQLNGQYCSAANNQMCKITFDANNVATAYGCISTSTK